MDPQADTAPAHEAAALGHDAARLALAWRELFEAEWALAARSIRAIAVAALVAPVLLAAVWFSVIALTVAALHALGVGWLAANALGCALQVALLSTLWRALRRWARDLTFVRSRAALERLRAPP